MKYLIGITIYNCFEIEADSEEEAEEKARELDVYQTLDDADYNITYVEEVKEMSDPKALHESTGGRSGRIYCDDEHGNSL